MASIYVEGYVFAKDTGLLLPVTIQLAVLSTGQLTGDPFFVEDGFYSAWVEQANQYTVGVKFSAKGYQSVIVPFTQLQSNPNIYLNKSKASEIIPLSAALLVIVAVANYRKKTGKVGKLKSGDIIPIFLLVGGVLAFIVVKKILELLGILDDKETVALDNLSTDPNSFWNPTFWQRIPPNQSYHYPLTESQAAEKCRQIYDSFGAFNDNEEQAINVFKSLHTQANASFIAWKFASLYNEDLLTFLRGGWWPQDRLSDDDVYQISEFVNKLPKY